MAGLLPGGLQGTLAHYTYYVRHQSSQGQSTTTPYPYTVVLVQLPETTAFVRKLLCHDERRIGGVNIFGLDFSGDEKVVLESAVINERYSIRTAAGQDQAWLRELFTPKFIDWLATRPMDEFSFELVDGLLCVSVGKRLDPLRPARLAVRGGDLRRGADPRRGRRGHGLAARPRS